MASWGVAKAKAQFSAVLDQAASEGPQLIRRRKECFVITTREEIERRFAEGAKGKRAKFISAWDALRPPFDERYDIDLPRVKMKARWVDFG
jgi:hypothetical protein